MRKSNIQQLKLYVQRINWFKVLLFSIFTSVLAAFLCTNKENGFDIYMGIAVPFFVVYLLLFALTEATQSSFSFTFTTVFLLLMGVTLQVLLTCNTAEGAGKFANSLFVYTLVGIALGFIGSIGLHLLLKLPRKLVYIIITATTAAMYLCLILFGAAAGETKAWITLFGITFQLTEICKVFGIVLTALLLTDQKLTPLQRALFPALAIGLHAVFLLILSELGTLLVIGLTYILLCMFYLPHKSMKYFGIIILALIGLGLLALLICYFCSRIKADLSIVNTLGSVFNKLSSRISLFLDENSDVYGTAYQVEQMKKSLSLANWFGTKITTVIPVVESDLIILYLISTFGIICLFLTLIVQAVFFISGICSLHNATPEFGSIGIGFVSATTVTALLSTASALCVIPIIGLGYPFLSRGGTGLAVNVATVVFCLITMTKPIIHRHIKEREDVLCRR